MTLRRGFKAEAERTAASLRTILGLPAHAFVASQDLARASQIMVVDAATLIDPDRLVDLENVQSFAFSACTFEINGRRIIVTNPLRSAGRRNSDIAHELSHVLLKHDLAEVRDVGGTYFRTCEPGEEEEATALGGTLLLPRPLLLRAAARGWDAKEIADHNDVTIEMAQYRLNTTGVLRQIGSARARRSP